ncbi:transcriptional repressor CTCFL-like [Leguminivora glycinivorella]|uniref:transcriptional repressor CTCFL-like n=1 Tax=Leguminivora glycinivorella TaxID=1035111 RepID=UPI00200DB16D|nr:transcriptional repressor CTCFL-like [Leguminivora glycinivorella]
MRARWGAALNAGIIFLSLFGNFERSFRHIAYKNKLETKMADLLVCRACLACKVPVYNILRTKYWEALENIAAISMADCSKPHALCAPCLETLERCCRLQEKCAISEGILSGLLHQNQLTADAIYAVDRQQHNLVDTLPTFTLKPMRPIEKLEESRNKIGSNTEPWRTQNLESTREKDAHNIKSHKRQSSENLRNEAVTAKPIRIDPDKMLNLEDIKDVVVKTEPDTALENPGNNIMTWIEPSTTQYFGEPSLYHNIKNEPGVTLSSEYMEPLTSYFVKEPHNEPDQTISIETVKLKETPYIQIDAGKLLGNVKSEVDSEDSKSFLEIDIEINQPIETEFAQTSKGKNYMNDILVSSSSKNVKVKCEIDRRRIKKVSSVNCEVDKPKTPEPSTDNVYNCNKCHYQTPHKKRIMYHMKKHSGFVMCDICNYQCATKSRLICHLRVHTKERPYKCKECNKRFTEVCSLTKHMNVHKGVKPFKCLWCNYETASKNHLDRHIKRHIGDKRFKCELCDYACVQRWDLKRHAKTHENDQHRPYKRLAPVYLNTVSIAKE